MKVEIVEARLDHVIQIVEDLHKVNRVVGVEKIVVQELNDSLLAWAGLLDGRCVVLWGVKSKALSDEGVLWMLPSQALYTSPIAFLRHSRREIEKLRGIFKCLHGCVLTDFTASKRWLEWLGFVVGPDEGGICKCELRWA